MADNLSKKPRKGILKNSSSFEGNERQREKGTKWDEMNILATLHPKDKDYGHMKIEEPKTPFAKYEEGDSGDEHDGLDADLLAKKIQLGGNELPKALIEPEPEEESDDEDISPEERDYTSLDRVVSRSGRLIHTPARYVSHVKYNPADNKSPAVLGGEGEYCSGYSPLQLLTDHLLFAYQPINSEFHRPGLTCGHVSTTAD
ncbi:protein phosphatase inhibitor 2-like isoform X2 [Homarus americanus]|uniref:protein phosphatase inhibitor 2-like isoform X2 n=1 Tax=Homarus americanus TaxID=6706 RepID=UPI001C46684D|nr:protein phosphatase inhibitor 2-like isoform X2 [Homarus americanus]